MGTHFEILIRFPTSFLPVSYFPKGLESVSLVHNPILTKWSEAVKPPKASLGPNCHNALVVFQNTVGLNVNLGSGELGGKPGVLAFFTDSQR